MIVRQWRLLDVLHRAGARGRSPTALQRELGVSKPTLYRDIVALIGAGIPISKEAINGERRYGFFAAPLPALAPSARELAALRLARRALIELEGTSLVRELDRLLKRWSKRDETEFVSHPHRSPAHRPEVVQRIDGAIEKRLRLRFRYQAAGQTKRSEREVDPLFLRWVDHHLYLVGWDLHRGAARTFKLARMTSLIAGPERAEEHPNVDEEALFDHSMKVWTGDLVDVVVRLAPDVARFVDEWPLMPDQHVECQSDGAAIVRARVAGTLEAMRWVLKWGQGAEVLEPEALRERVRGELVGALAGYGGASVKMPAGRWVSA